MEVYATREVENTRLIRRYRICNLCGVRRGTYEIEDPPNTAASVRVMVSHSLRLRSQSA